MNEQVKKIILVEDDSAIADVYSVAIKKNHFELEVVASAREAIKKVKELSLKLETKPDLVLLDLILPDMNGTEVLTEIKGQESTKDIAVFILTNQESTIMQDVQAKPEKFIIKANTTPTQLIEIIKQFFSL